MNAAINPRDYSPFDQEPEREPVLTYLKDVVAEDVAWLWPSRLARGKFTLWAGEPGLGKTYIAIDNSARISRGLRFPDGHTPAVGRTLILSAEDGIADTILPRFVGQGGDVRHVAVLEAIKETDGTRTSVSLTRDLPMLERAITEFKPDYVWIDPLNAYLGKTDTHRDAEVRAALAPVIDLAQQHHFALQGICHLSKDAQKAALHRPGGSIAFVAAARIVLAVTADPNDHDRRLLVPLKSNICKPSQVLAFRITNDRLVWEADPVAGCNVEALFRPTAHDREDQTDAEQVIRDLLDDDQAWPMEAKHAIEAGQAHGIAERTMRWTAKKLGIRISRLGFGGRGKWLWYRPEPIPATGSPCPIDVAAIAAMEIHSAKEEELKKSVNRGNVASVMEEVPVEDTF
jgi:putative DNA primase/helicase